MVPGVYRGYSLVDILGTLNGQGATAPATTVTGVGAVVEADESAPLADAATALSTPAANQTWDRMGFNALAWA